MAAPLDDGHVFPNGCDAGTDLFEVLGAVYPAYASYLPTRQSMDLVLARFGERARPTMAAWHEIWAGSVGDVEAYAKGIKLKTPGPERPEDAVPDPNHPGPAFVRPVSFHILQEAVELVELMRAGTPFLMRLYGTGIVRSLCRRPGVRRLVEAAHVVTVGDGAPVGPTTLGELREGFKVTGHATPYWSLPEFRERAGRGMAVAATPAALVDVVTDMRRQGHRKAFLKGSATKSGTWVMDLDFGGDAAAVEARLKALLGNSWTKAWGGRKRPFLVQGMVPFVAEHRFFVVRHRVVATTASDRALSVLDASPRRIVDERVAWLAEPARTAGYYDRGECGAAVDRTLAARMAWGARDLARALRRAGTAMDCYVIDMGLTADGRVLPVEINGMTWAGLYAVPYARVARALTRRAAAMAPHVVPVPERLARHPVEAVAPAVSRLVAARDAMPPRDSRHLRSFVERRSGRHKVPRPHPRLGGMTVVPDPGSFQDAPVPVSAPWRRRWLRELAKGVHREVGTAAIDVMCGMRHGRLRLTRPLLFGAGLQEGLASMPGWAHGWEWDPSDSGDWDRMSGLGELDDPSTVPRVGITVGIDDIDLAVEVTNRRPMESVSLREGGHARVEWAVGGTREARSALAGIREVRVTAAAARAAPGVRELRPDEAEALRAHAAAHASGDAAWDEFLIQNRASLWERLRFRGRGEAAWAELGRVLMDEAREVDAELRFDGAMKFVDALRGRALRGMGRIALVSERGLPDRAYRLVTDGFECGTSYLSASAPDIDLPRTATWHAGTREGGDVVFLREGAPVVTVTVTGGAEVADAA